MDKLKSYTTITHKEIYALMEDEKISVMGKSLLAAAYVRFVEKSIAAMGKDEYAVVEHCDLIRDDAAKHGFRAIAVTDDICPIDTGPDMRAVAVIARKFTTHVVIHSAVIIGDNKTLTAFFGQRNFRPMYYLLKQDGTLTDTAAAEERHEEQEKHLEQETQGVEQQAPQEAAAGASTDAKESEAVADTSADEHSVSESQVASVEPKEMEGPMTYSQTVAPQDTQSSTVTLAAADVDDIVLDASVPAEDPQQQQNYNRKKHRR